MLAKPPGSTLQTMTELAATTTYALPAARVSDVMHWGLVHCPPEASLRAVAALMSRERVHCVVVADDPNDARSLWGVVSDLDLIAASTVRSLDEQPAGGTAMKPAITVYPHESLEAVAERMTTLGVSHFVVVDTVGQRPLGVVSTLDVAGALATPPSA
jgi:CBS domain-containing protein